MVYRPAMAMSQSLDVIFPSPRIYFTVEKFVLASPSFLDDNLNACLHIALSITANPKILFLSFAHSSSSAAVRSLFSWVISSLKMTSCAMKKSFLASELIFLVWHAHKLAIFGSWLVE
jgi:hypothetical protein